MNILVKKLIMTRPYSWVGVIMVAVLANVLATGALAPDFSLAYDIATAFLVWYVATSVVEFFHGKIDMRGMTSPLIPLVSLLPLLVLLWFGNPLTLPVLAVILAADLAYSMKTRDWPLARFSFMLRGVLEVAVLVIVLLFHGVYDFAPFLPLMLAVLLVTNSRNLIGDIRDMDYDKHAFPKHYGSGASYTVSVLLVLVSLALLQDILVMLPLLLMCGAMAVYRNPYELHRLFVLATTFFYANYSVSALGHGTLITNLLFLAVLLGMTYPMVPRKSNPRTAWFYSYRPTE